MFDFLKKKNEAFTGLNPNPTTNTQTDFMSNTNQFPSQEQPNSSFNNGFNNGFGNNNPNNSFGNEKNFGEPDRFNPENNQHFHDEPEPMPSGGYNQNQYLGQMDKGNNSGDIGVKHSFELLSKSIEVMSSKLDSIRFSLDSINQRLTNIERIANSEGNNNNKNNSW